MDKNVLIRWPDSLASRKYKEPETHWIGGEIRNPRGLCVNRLPRDLVVRGKR
jgi:hypothetical protein